MFLKHGSPDMSLRTCPVHVVASPASRRAHAADPRARRPRPKTSSPETRPTPPPLLVRAGRSPPEHVRRYEHRSRKRRGGIMLLYSPAKTLSTPPCGGARGSRGTTSRGVTWLAGTQLTSRAKERMLPRDRHLHGMECRRRANSLQWPSRPEVAAQTSEEEKHVEKTVCRWSELEYDG